MWFAITVYTIMTIQCIMLIGHYFCHWTGLPVKYFIEGTGKFPYIIGFLCSVLNTIVAIRGDEIETIHKVAVGCNIVLVCMIVLPALYVALETYRESFKKYKDY